MPISNTANHSPQAAQAPMPYRVHLIGPLPKTEITKLRNALDNYLQRHGLMLHGTIDIRQGFSAARGDDIFPGMAAALAIFAGTGANSVQLEQEAELALKCGFAVQSVVSATSNLEREISSPHLRKINAISYGELNLAPQLLLEKLGLLHSGRKIFISYQRSRTSVFATKLFERLSAQRFEVFLDTHKIRKGDDFQEELLQHLIDCDVLVLLLSDGALKSKWIRCEIASAFTKGIPVLVVAPNRTFTGKSRRFAAALLKSNLVSVLPVPRTLAAKSLKTGRPLCWRSKGSAVTQTLSDIATRCEWLRSIGYARRMQALKGYVKTILGLSQTLGIVEEQTDALLCRYRQQHQPGFSMPPQPDDGLLKLTVISPRQSDFFKAQERLNHLIRLSSGRPGKASNPWGFSPKLAVLYEDYCLNKQLRQELDLINHRLCRAQYIPVRGTTDQFARTGGQCLTVILAAAASAPYQINSEHSDLKRANIRQVDPQQIDTGVQNKADPTQYKFADDIQAQQALLQLALRQVLLAALPRGTVLWAGSAELKRWCKVLCRELKLEKFGTHFKFYGAKNPVFPEGTDDLGGSEQAKPSENSYDLKTNRDAQQSRHYRKMSEALDMMERSSRFAAVKVILLGGGIPESEFYDTLRERYSANNRVTFLALTGTGGAAAAYSSGESAATEKSHPCSYDFYRILQEFFGTDSDGNSHRHDGDPRPSEGSVPDTLLEQLEDFLGPKLAAD